MPLRHHRDRLVKGLRFAKARSREEAQTYLKQEYLPRWNESFTRVPEGSSDAHRPLRAEHQLAAILNHVEERFEASDYTIRCQGKMYQIVRRDVRPGLCGGQARVEQRLDGSMAVKFRQYRLRVVERQVRPQPSAPLSR